MLEFRVLGEVEALRDGKQIALGPYQRRAVLGILLIESNRPVPMDRLAKCLWGPETPTGAASSIQAHVSRLRVALRNVDTPDRDTTIVTRPSGYLLSVGSATTDVGTFERTTAQARATRGHQAKALYESALRLWRGRPLGMPPYANALVGGLEEKRLLVLEDYFDTRLQLDEHMELVPDLVSASRDHPFRPRLTASLMTALYRAGRAADALIHYKWVRRKLTETIGLEPPVELRLLQQAILREDTALFDTTRQPWSMLRQRSNAS